MTDSRFKTLTDHFETVIKANTDAQAVFSGLQGRGNKKIFVTYGVKSDGDINMDANGTIDTKHRVLFVAHSGNYETCDKVIEDILTLWCDTTSATVRTAFSDAGGLLMTPKNVYYAVKENAPKKQIAAVEFLFTMRTTY